MEATQLQGHRRFINRTNDRVIVEVIGQGQFRLGELRQPVVVYLRGDCVYIRLVSEFHTKFKPYDQENQGRL